MPPESAEAARIVAQILDGTHGARRRPELLALLEAATDPRIERYWQLTAIITGRGPFQSLQRALEWLATALQASQTRKGGRPMIEIRGLTKHYGSTAAVNHLSFDVLPGAVTGFLGLNGSGKSTTMRMILGLDAPDAGHARIGGQAYRDLRWPLREAGGLLEYRAFHPGRPARAHLAALAASNAISSPGFLRSWR